MKVLIILALALTVAFAVKGEWPRTEQACDSAFYGWFWDG